MAEKNKTHDLRDEGPPPTSVTNTQSRMAGGADNPNVAPKDDTPLSRPEVHDRKPTGEVVKGS
ncbi:MAG: hypothetical protein ACREFW_03375 [Rhizomicrobium sp.]